VLISLRRRRAQAERMNEIVTLFHTLTTGVYVVGVSDGAVRDAFTAASITQVSYQPLLLSLAINPEHASYKLLLAGKGWTVSVLRRDQIEWARRFGIQSPQGVDKMQGVKWESAGSGAPFLKEALAYFECRLVAEHAAGDHRIVLGQVVAGAVLMPESNAKPLVYADTGNLDQSAPLYPTSFT
jgi:flavin reductase (DIM6/NTAB) family NADH-FMN oxidoreductase RutF